MKRKNERKRSTRTRTLTIALSVAAIAFTLVWIISFLPSNHAENPVAPTSPTSSTKAPNPERPTTQSPATSAPKPTSTLLEQIPETTKNSIIEAGTKVVLAYSGRNWQDPQPTTWLSRLTPLCSTQYAQQMQHLYGQGKGGLEWSEFVSTQSNTKAEIEQVRLIRTDQIKQGTVQLMVSYAVTTTNGKETITSGPLKYQQILTLKLISDQWKAASLVPAVGDPSAS